MKPEDYELKGWMGTKAHVLAKCKYCKMFSMAEVCLVDPIDKKPYHPLCKEKHDREIADDTQNLSEGSKPKTDSSQGNVTETKTEANKT